MPKKKSYDAYVRQQMGDLIDQLQLSSLEKQSLKERWLDQMIWADKKAAQSRRAYYRLRLTTVVGGVLLPALVGISLQLGQNNKFFRVWFPPLTFALSQVIAVSVAIEEFCKFGDRWRDYRKMAEDLKSEGWHYLQSSGSYEVSEPLEQSLAHERYFAQFSSRVESIIKNDVESYISNLKQHQAKQDAETQRILAQAQAVGSRKNLNEQTFSEPLQGAVPALYPSTNNSAPSNGDYAATPSDQPSPSDPYFTTPINNLSGQMNPNEQTFSEPLQGAEPALYPSAYNTAQSNTDYSTTPYQPSPANEPYLRAPISTPGNGQPPQALPAPHPSTYNTAQSNVDYSAYQTTASQPLPANEPYLRAPISTPGNGQPPQALPAPHPSTYNTAPSNGDYSTYGATPNQPLPANEPYLRAPISTPGNGQPPQIAPPAAIASTPTPPPTPPPVTPPQMPPSAPQPAPVQAATDLNATILAAALKLKGMSTSEGPDGGRNACAWTVNRVLHEANIPALGDNPKYVPAVLEALKSGRGQLVAPHAAKAGDLVIAAGEYHIGISLDDGCQTVLSNSSSRARFCWESNVDYDGYYGGSSTIYRLLK